MSQEFYPYLVITADIILLTTLPLLLRLLTILISRNRQFIGLESDFYRCLTHILLVDLVSALISILAVEPATYGVFREFYENNSGWISKVVIFHSSILCILSIYFHSLIAFNRLTAMLFTMHHHLIWTHRLLRNLHFAGWFLSIFLSLPLIWPIRGSYAVVQSPFGVRGLSFVLTTSEANIAYQGPPVIIGATFEIIILIVYSVIIVNVRKYKEIGGAVIRTTAASLFMCSSGWFLIIFVAVASYYGHACNGDLFSVEVYYAFFKIGYAVNGSITSWVTLIVFRDIRSRVFPCFNRSQHTQIAESHSRSNRSTTKSGET